MCEKKIILIILMTVVINTGILYIYDNYIKKDNPIILPHRNPLLNTKHRFEENDHINFNRQTAITEAVNIISPTVVSVNVWRTEIIRRHPFHDDWIFDSIGVPRTREVQSIGSGVVLDSDGNIITNAHVVNNASQIKVVMFDSTEHDAVLIGIDSVHDIAIIKINSKNLYHATLGTSSDLMIGEWSIAVGNPYGFLMKDSKPSVSVGVISALERNFSDLDDTRIFRGMIQTDATINPGNSGGPLVNIFGEVIGINTLILTDNGASYGIGFAIPIDRVKRIAEELITYGRIRESYFGFRIQELTPFIASYLNLRSLDGVVISNIDQNGPAHNAGLRRGDIITMINDVAIRNATDAEIGMSDSTPGNIVNINIIREGREIGILLVAEEHSSGNQ